MVITSSGIGSGLDINSLVKQLVAAEGKAAKDMLDRRESVAKDRLSALGGLKGALSSFHNIVSKLKNSDLFKTHAATSSNESVLAVSAAASAAMGTYSISVERLAQVHQLVSGGSGFANGSAVVGTGTLTIQLGADSSNAFSVAIGSDKSSLAGIRDAVNAAPENKGVTASIINVDDGVGGTVSRLALTSNNTGATNALTITASDDDGNNTDAAGLSQLISANMLEKSVAQDALVKINGFDVTRPSNTITDAVDGLTLNLKTASPGTPVSVGVSLDKSAISKSVTEFVDAYNKLASVVKSLGSYDPQSKEAGSLLGDSMLRNLQSQLRGDMGNPVASAPGEYNTLQMIGVEIDASGVMSLKQGKLEAALAVNVNTVSNVFASSDGVATRLDSRIKSYVQSGGSLDSRTQGLNGTLREISKARDAQQLRLDKLETSLLKQFNAMDAMVAQFNATGAFLTQRFK